MLELTNFEAGEHCNLLEGQLKVMKERLEKQIEVLNNRVKEVEVPLFDQVVRQYECELNGMKMMLAIAFVDFEIEESLTDEKVGETE